MQCDPAPAILYSFLVPKPRLGNALAGEAPASRDGRLPEAGASGADAFPSRGLGTRKNFFLCGQNVQYDSAPAILYSMRYVILTPAYFIFHIFNISAQAGLCMISPKHGFIKHKGHTNQWGEKSISGEHFSHQSGLNLIFLVPKPRLFFSFPSPGLGTHLPGRFPGFP